MSDKVSNLLSGNDKQFHNQIVTSSLIISNGKQSALVLNKEDKNSRLVENKKREFKSKNDAEQNYNTKDVPEAQLMQSSIDLNEKDGNDKKNIDSQGLSMNVSTKSLAKNESIESTSDILTVPANSQHDMTTHLRKAKQTAMSVYK